MSRVGLLSSSIGVGSIHVGIRDLSGTERRAIFQFVSVDPFAARVFATQDFDFTLNTGSNWTEVTDRIFFDQGPDDPDFVQVNGKLQRRRNSRVGLPISQEGLYALDEGFMPAAFLVDVTSVTSGTPLKILFGV